MQKLKLDSLGIAETHLTGNNTIEIDGFKWVGNNRKKQHTRAKTGSGWVGFLIKDCFYDAFNIDVLDDDCDDILWLRFTEKQNDKCFFACVCYLPPCNSSRHTDVYDLYDHLLVNIYKYQDEGTIYIYVET